MMMELKPKE